MPFSTSCFAIRKRGTDQVGSHPPVLFGAAVFATLLFLLVRGLLPSQGSPALFREAASGPRVYLGEGFHNPGVRQFYDGATVSGVTQLTGQKAVPSGLGGSDSAPDVLVDGSVLELSGNTGEIERGWMPARQRLALGIPLHPDRMTVADWETLPGIGAKLAAQIELDRQNNGDFGSFEALDRVKGIGPAKLKKLEPYFSSGQ